MAGFKDWIRRKAGACWPRHPLWLLVVPIAILIVLLLRLPVGAAAFVVLLAVLAVRIRREVLIILTAIVAAWACTAIFFVLTHISTVAGNAQPDWFRGLVNNVCDPWVAWIFEVLRFDRAALSAPGVYAMISADMIGVCAFLFAVWPLVQTSLHRFRLAKEITETTGLKVVVVQEQGEDDLDTMLHHYQGAEHLTIFCGRFDWLGKKAAMREFIEGLATDEKLDLISYRREADVEQAFGEKDLAVLYEHLIEHDCFRFESGLDIKCSLIKKIGTESRFLYRSASDGHNPFNACILTGKPHTIEHLHILTQLVGEPKERGVAPVSKDDE